MSINSWCRFPEIKGVDPVPFAFSSECLLALFNTFQVCTYLTSKSWETRIAAGQAVEAIAKNVKRWQPGNSSSRQTSPSPTGGPAEGGRESGRSKESSPDSDKDSDLLTFDAFDLEKVTSAIYMYTEKFITGG